MKRKIILSMVLSALLVFAPCYVNAVDENTGSEDKTNNETVVGGEENKENTNNDNKENTNNENKEDKNESTDDEKEDNSSENTPAEKQKSISFGDEYEITLNGTETKKLSVIVEPSDAEIVWTSLNEKIVTVDQKGNVKALNKSGTTKIKATIKDTEISAECSVTVVGVKGNDATLKELTVNGKLEPKFQPNVFEYKVSIDEDVSSLDFEYKLSDPNATAFKPSDSKNKDLKNGSTVEFKVVAEDGKTNNTYKFTVVKQASSLELKSLAINGYALNEVFDPSINDYTASIPYEIDTLTIKSASKASDKEVSIKVSGITNLKVGVNTVKIVLTDLTDDTKKNTYTIKVTREKKVSVEEKPTSIITSEIIDNNDNNSNTNNNSSTSVPDTNKNSGSDDDILKYAIVSLACLILFTIGGIGIYFYIKTSPRRLNKIITTDKKEEESDSALVEISDESIEKQSNIEKMMEEKLIETREFKREDLNNLDELEDLLDDSEDV